MKKWILVAVGLLIGISLTTGVLNAADQGKSKHVITVYGKYTGAVAISDVVVTINGYTFPPDHIADPSYYEYVPENLPLPWVVEFKDGGRILCTKVIKEIPPNVLSIEVNCP